MLKTLVYLSTGLAFLSAAIAFKIGGKGENAPTVQSSSGGYCYIRSIPFSDYGTDGKTEVFRVRAAGDELLDQYPLYMRGQLYLGWNPLAGKWCIVQVEPERITSENDMMKVGKVSRLVFYMGGKELASYGADDLSQMGLRQQVSTLVYHIPGQFLVRGIQQVPLTDQYTFVVERTAEAGTEIISLSITTGKVLSRESRPRMTKETPNQAMQRTAGRSAFQFCDDFHIQLAATRALRQRSLILCLVRS